MKTPKATVWSIASVCTGAALLAGVLTGCASSSNAEAVSGNAEAVSDAAPLAATAGLSQGAAVKAFDVTDITGARKGKTLCYV